MSDNTSATPIPEAVALQLCDEISGRFRGKWYFIFATQCFFCTLFSRKNAANLCFYATPGNRGCQLVNTRYDRRAANS